MQQKQYSAVQYSTALERQYSRGYLAMAMPQRQFPMDGTTVWQHVRQQQQQHPQQQYQKNWYMMTWSGCNSQCGSSDTFCTPKNSINTPACRRPWWYGDLASSCLSPRPPWWYGDLASSCLSPHPPWWYGDLASPCLSPRPPATPHTKGVADEPGNDMMPSGYATLPATPTHYYKGFTLLPMHVPLPGAYTIECNAQRCPFVLLVLLSDEPLPAFTHVPGHPHNVSTAWDCPPSFCGIKRHTLGKSPIIERGILQAPGAETVTVKAATQVRPAWLPARNIQQKTGSQHRRCINSSGWITNIKSWRERCRVIVQYPANSLLHTLAATWPAGHPNTKSCRRAHYVCMLS
jgi:hypothetical protein